LFLKSRVWCLHDAGRYAETFLWSARALQFAPDDPHFAQDAYATADLAMKHRYRKKYPGRPIPPPERNEEFCFDLGEFLAIHERSLFLTIAAHHAESLGQLDKARTAFEEACRQNFHGNNEQRDLQRFVRKHGRRTAPLLPPKNIGQPRRIKLSCPPQEEAPILRRLVDEFERGGKLLKARDTLHDLYLFDPTDAEVFHRARAIEQRPQFQAQLKRLLEEHRRTLQGQKH
jgi:tetratricopeptide (TPR) repeat protein